MEQINKQAGWFSSCLSVIRSEDLTGRVLILCAASCFFPFILSASVSFVSFVFLLFQRRLCKKTFARKSLIPMYVLFFLLLAVPICRGRWLGVLAGLLTVCITMFFLLCCTRMSNRLFETILPVCCLASYVSLAYAIGEKIVWGTAFRSTGGIYNANYYGTMLEFIMMICLYQIARKRPGRTFYFVTIACSVLGILLCDCQSAWLAVLGGTLLLLYLCGKRRFLWVVPVSVLLLLGGALFIPGVLPRLSMLPQNAATRFSIWHNAVQAFLKNPVFGGGTLAYYYLGDTSGVRRIMHAHSIYLDALLSYGLVGTGIWLYHVRAYIMHLYRRYRACRYPAPLVMGIIGTVMIHGVTDHTTLWVQTGMLLAVLLSGAFAKREIVLDTPEKT